jgi:Ser/Thr protein kinase RdoA (MazF antagonist)
MSAPSDADARTVLRTLRRADNPLSRLGNAGGFSGAALWRVAGEAHDFCLKALPVGADAGRHGQIAKLLDWTRRKHDLTYVPGPRFVSEGAGRVWELVEWMPGAADFHANASPARLSAASVALARLHRAWEQCPGPPAGLQPCPGLLRRVKLAREWHDLVAGGWRPAFAQADPVTPWAERAWAVACRAVPGVVGQLAPWQSVPVPVQPCVCDVWHDHVLFTGDAVTGLIDYGSVKRDGVAVDLARLLGSLVGDDAAAVAAGLAAYEEVRPLGGAERALVPVLDRTGVVLGLANWLRWLYHDRRTYADRPAVARRLAGLVRRAEVWK